MSSTVELYPGVAAYPNAEAYYQKNRPDFTPREQAELDRRIGDIIRAYGQRFSTFKAAHDAGRSDPLTHEQENIDRAYDVTQAIHPDNYKKIPGLGLGAANFLYKFELRLIEEDTANVQIFKDELFNRMRREAQTGLRPVEPAVFTPIILSASDRPPFPQTSAFQPTDHSPLEAASSTKIEDISFREVAHDGTRAEVIDINAASLRSVRNVVDSIQVPEEKPLVFPASLFEPAQPRFSDDIKRALTKMNGAWTYISKVRKDMASLSAGDAREYLKDKLEPDRLYVLSQLEKTSPSDTKFGILKGLDVFLKREMAKIDPVANPAFDTETPAEPVIAVTSPLDQDLNEDNLIRRSKAHQAAIRQLNGVPLNRYIEEVLLPEKEKMDTLLAARQLSGHPSVSLLKNHTQYLEILRTRAEHKFGMIPVLTDPPAAAPAPAMKEAEPSHLTPENKEIIQMVQKGTPSERFHLLQRLRLDHEDVFNQFQNNRKSGLSHEDNRQTADQLSFLRTQITELKARLETEYKTAKAGQHQAPSANREAETASVIKPEKKGFFSRLKDSVSSTVTSVRESFSRLVENPAARKTAAAVVMGAGAIGIGAGALNLAGDQSETSAIKDKTEAAYKVEPRPIVENTFTVIVPPDAKAAPMVTAEAPVATAETTPAPVLKTAAPARVPTARADFSVKSAETYAMPDSLKVTFNNGSTSRFDKETWQKSCEQLKSTGSASPTCEELALKNG